MSTLKNDGTAGAFLTGATGFSSRNSSSGPILGLDISISLYGSKTLSSFILSSCFLSSFLTLMLSISLLSLFSSCFLSSFLVGIVLSNFTSFEEEEEEEGEVVIEVNDVVVIVATFVGDEEDVVVVVDDDVDVVAFMNIGVVSFFFSSCVTLVSILGTFAVFFPKATLRGF